MYIITVHPLSAMDLIHANIFKLACWQPWFLWRSSGRLFKVS